MKITRSSLTKRLSLRDRDSLRRKRWASSSSENRLSRPQKPKLKPLRERRRLLTRLRNRSLMLPRMPFNLALRLLKHRRRLKSSRKLCSKRRPKL